MHRIAFAQAKTFDWAVGRGEQRRQVGIIAIGQQQAVARYEPDEMFEGGPDRLKVFKNVRVIELQIVDDCHLWQVMDELAAFVEEGGVVFVPFDDEPLAVGEAGALAEIVGETADEVAWIEAIVLEHPGQQRGGGGLAVGASDDEGAFAANEKLFQQLRQRAIAQPVVQHVLGFGVATRNGVAHDNEVRFVGEVSFGVATDHFDSSLR